MTKPCVLASLKIMSCTYKGNTCVNTVRTFVVVPDASLKFIIILAKKREENACTLVPTVFRWHGKMEFKFHFHFSFFVFA